MCKVDIVRLQMDALMELFTSMSGINIYEMGEAINRVFAEVEIPPRGPKGSDRNIMRVNVFTIALIRELEQIKKERE